MGLTIIAEAARAAVVSAQTQPAQGNALVAPFEGGEVTARIYQGAELAEVLTLPGAAVDLEATPVTVRLAGRVARTNYIDGAVPTRVVFASPTDDVLEFDAGVGSGSVSFASPLYARRRTRLNVSITTWASLPRGEVEGEVPDAPTVLSSRVLNMGKVLQFRQWSTPNRYERFVRNTFLSNTSTNDIAIVINEHNNTDPKLSGSYELRVYEGGEGSPSVLATLTAPGTSNSATFTAVDLSSLDDGWHLFDIRPVAEGTGETAHPYWMHVGDATTQTWAPVQTGSFGITHEEGGTAYWGKVPLTLAPDTFAFERRGEVTTFDYAANRADLYRRNLVPCINGDPHYLRRIPHPGGGFVWTCLNNHGYAFNVFAAFDPATIFRDGPYGVGLISGPTHLQVGRLRPDVDHAAIYFADTGSIGKIEPDGHIKRFAGWRDTDAGRVLVGDWTAIPEARRGFHLIWGFAWSQPTVDESNLDTTRTVDRGDGVQENPHSTTLIQADTDSTFTGPTLFVADSLTENVNSRPGRILRVRFAPDSHDATAVVDEFVADSHNAWDVVYWAGWIIVSERRDHRIAAYNAVTGAFVRTIIQTSDGNSYAQVSEDDRPNLMPGVSLATARAQACLLPEGLFVQDGWLYFGSIVMGQVKKIDLSTLDAEGGPTVQVACEFTPVSKSEYCKFALSDGTFGPRGTIFIATWEVDRMGMPWAFLPDGSSWNIYRTASRVADRGRTTNGLAGIGYSTAVGCGNGILVCGGADYGVVELRLARAGDITVDEALYAAGQAAYEAAGYRLTHGIDGYGQYGYPLPWGEREDIDYFLTIKGHEAP